MLLTNERRVGTSLLGDLGGLQRVLRLGEMVEYFKVDAYPNHGHLTVL